MGATHRATGIGAGIGPGWADPASAWSYPGAIFDADFARDRFALAGRNMAGKAAFLAAAGGVEASGAIRIGPYDIPGAPEKVSNGDFSDGTTTGWTAFNTASLGVAGGILTLTGGGGNIPGFRQALSLLKGHAYRARASMARRSGSIDPTLTIHSSASFSGNPTLYRAPGNLLTLSPVDNTFSASDDTMYVGGRIIQNSSTSSVDFDDISVTEVLPMAGWVAGSFSAIVWGVMPAAASGDKVIFEATGGGVRYLTGDNQPHEGDRVRLVWDSSAHLRVIVTQREVEQANLDLGVVAALASFQVILSAAENDFMARLVGGATLFDLSGSMPGLAKLFLNRQDATGSTFDGTVSRLVLFPAACSETYKLAMWGDSLVASLAGSMAGYSGGRPAYNGGVGGDSIAQIATRQLADTTYRDRIAVLWDRSNDGDNTAYATAMAQMVARVRQKHDRFVVVSDINKTDGTENSGSSWRTAQNARNAALAAAYPGHFVDVVAALDDNALRTDGLHLTGAGNLIVGNAIIARVAANGW